MSRAAGAFLIAGALAAGVYLLLPRGGVGQGIVYLAVLAATAVALAIGIGRHDPPQRRLWTLLLASTALYFAVAVLWYMLPVAFDAPLSPASWVETLGAIAVLGWAVFLYSALRLQAGRDPASTLDVFAVALAVGAVSVEAVLEPILETKGEQSWARSVLSVSCLLLLMSMGLRLALTQGRRPSHLLAMAWMGLYVAAGLVYTVLIGIGEFRYGQPWIALWILAHAALGAMALHPTMATMTTPGDADPLVGRSGRLVMLGLAATAPLAVLALHGEAEPDHLIVHIAITALVFGIVLARLAGLAVDLEEQRRTRTRIESQADELERLAYSDPLTGLANRTRFTRELAALLDAETGSGAGLVVLDVDSFKTVNDTLGHAEGDRLLLTVAERLTEVAGPDHLVARMGGDEFAILRRGDDPVAAHALAQRAVAEIRAPVRLTHQQLLASASAGVAAAPAGSDLDELFSRADVAMYAAKERRRGRVQIFDPELHEAMTRKYRIRTDLRAAAAFGQLLLHYQPIVELATGRIIGVEALVRWDHPELGVLLPDEFIPIAEACAVMDEIGQWVVKEAARQLGRWERAADCPPDFLMSVNVSVTQLADAATVEELALVLEESDAGRFIVEVTESSLLEEAEARMGHFKRLRQTGATLAIDDFGTGYSSLSYLRRLPADILKIDRAFVEGIGREHQEFAVTAAIVRLATSAGKRTLGEGIERPEQAAHLLALGCRLGQGFLFSPPLPPDELAALLRDKAGIAKL